jgi:hypothetical protein
VTIVIVGPLLAGAAAVCGFQISYGTYLGLGWMIAVLAGMATAAGLSAAALISARRHGWALGRAGVAWLVLGLISSSAIRYPFPVGPYGGVQAFFNVVHASLLGYEAVICVEIISLLAYSFARFCGLLGGAVPQQPVRGSTARAGHALDRGEHPARLRFPGAEAAAWRAGRLIAASGSVMWLSRNSDAAVDLTPACQALLMLPADGRKRWARTTTLMTAYGLAEVDLSPKALKTLASSLRRPPCGDTAAPAVQD